MSRRPLVAGNWKMNGASADLATFGAIVDGRMEGVAETLIHPPATLIAAFASLARESHVGVGAQDCHPAASGAHTGDLSAEMLRDAGAEAVIVGHSERRADHGETDAIVRAKAEAVLRAGLLAIICVGETREERDAGRAVEVVQSQLTGSLPDSARASTVVVAYEPVWAIGTGLTATTDDIAEIHGAVRASLAGRFGAAEADAMRVLYGGSVKPGNAAEIFALADVDGGLVGGASLKAEDFLAIAAAAD